MRPCASSGQGHQARLPSIFASAKSIASNEKNDGPKGPTRPVTQMSSVGVQKMPRGLRMMQLACLSYFFVRKACSSAGPLRDRSEAVCVDQKFSILG